ncbi:hypothetical protein FOZ60_006986 [Perkinsus olseni]|uniref:Uncharacterized protein n=1 Tax=Perkinsus olseni TaxID=32597 RepID=A0A7J6NMN5_PEROL|nr:hypothetical protein FOZ60_006986 [Perkinsus olseni]
MALAGGLLYIPLELYRIVNVHVLHSWSKEFKLAYSFEAPRIGRIPVQVQLHMAAEEVGNLRLRMIRPHPYAKCEVIHNMRVEAERINGSLYPVTGNPPIHVAVYAPERDSRS